MSSESIENAPSSKQATAATHCALWILAGTFLMAITTAQVGGWLTLGLMFAVLICMLVTIGAAVAEWVKYFRKYVDHAVQRQAMGTDDS